MDFQKFKGRKMSSSCDHAYDLVLSAIHFSQFNTAKKLCEIFFFKNKNNFSFLYALTNSALKNDTIVKNIISTITFSEGLKRHDELAKISFYNLPAYDSKLDQDGLIQLLHNDITNENSQIRKFMSSKYF